MPRISLVDYHLETDYVLTWYPVQETDNLAEVKMRGGTYGISVLDVIPGWTHGPDVGDDLTTPPLQVGASLRVGVNGSRLFTAELEVRIGRTRRMQSLVVRPDSRVPFMLNVEAKRGADTVGNTAAVFHGVFNASPRLKLSDLVNVIGR
jgi:hypothetical protein